MGGEKERDAFCLARLKPLRRARGPYHLPFPSFFLIFPRSFIPRRAMLSRTSKLERANRVCPLKRGEYDEPPTRAFAHVAGVCMTPRSRPILHGLITQLILRLHETARYGNIIILRKPHLIGLDVARTIIHLRSRSLFRADVVRTHFGRLKRIVNTHDRSFISIAIDRPKIRATLICSQCTPFRWSNPVPVSFNRF